MKKKLVAVVLCVTMCLATVLETGAASFSSPDSIDTGVAEQSAEMETPVDVPEENIFAEDIFTAGETEDTADVITNEIPEEVPNTDNVSDVFSAGVNDKPIAVPVAGSIVVSAEDWEASGENYRLYKATAYAAAEANANEGNTEEPVISEAEEVLSAEMLTDGEEVPEAYAAEELPAEEASMDEETSQPDASSAPGYYTEADGIVLISTEYKDVIHTGYYLFDENGYLVTGKKKIKAGTYNSNTDTEFYFTDKKNAVVYSEFAGEKISPVTSDLGQQKKNDWAWTGTVFCFYDENGKFMTVTELDEVYKQTGKYTGYYKINGEYYCLKADGTPRTGNIVLKAGTSSAKYYFQTAEETGGIPGKMFHNGWRTFKGTNGERWLYYNQGATNPADVGKLYERGTVATKLDPQRKGNYTYLIDKYGYILKSTMRKAENGAYYCTDSRGVIYRDKLVRYKNLRYYFRSDGKRAAWKNSWNKCPGASNRYYYFGSVAGRVEEKTGWQKVTASSGKFYGWFYFNTKGNHYVNALTSTGYYFTNTGKLAGGIYEVNGKKYLFEVSDENTHRGKMYKNTLVYYKNQWFYATENGVLRKSGWQNVKGGWYYFDNYRALTNRFMKKDGVNGYLDSTGKYTTGWVIVSNTSNLVRYIDPDGNGFLKNGSKWVNGLLYYFDSNGYRINDLTNTYGGPYYVTVDRVNGVMTVYNSAKTVPVKTIRVSVGNSWTPTPSGTYTLYRSLRWQPLMGPSWGQYGTHVAGAGQGGIFVHSVACGQANSYNLPAGEYNKLGSPASHGCIRASVGDAKWVYDNCNGARIHIFDGSYNSNEAMKGPLGRKQLVPLRYPYNFDPTDPAV